MHFKRIYIEISDYCNLSCSFCTSKKNTRIMNISNFKKIINDLIDYTDEVVLHVLGEPLVHKDIIEMVKIASVHFKVMITTNGILLSKFLNVDFIKFNKMNISLHSSYNMDYENTIAYLNNIYEFICFTHSINDKIPFNLRLWANTNDEIKTHNRFIVDWLNKKYDVLIDKDNFKIKDYVIITSDSEFTWPSLENPYNTNKGTCKGGKTHLAILANGIVSICCLDANGDSNLGNVFDTPFKEIVESEKFQNVRNGFRNNQLLLDICTHCTYHNRKE